MVEKNKSGLVYVDTSGWYALVDESDPEHRPVREWFEENKTPLITSDYVFDETITLIRTSLGHQEAVQFGERLKESKVAQLISVPKGDRERAWEIFKKYDDQVFSFTDCVSFAQMERLDIRTALALDDDFKIMDYSVVPR
ncbi:PIN domain-containing protein [Candidatus Bipolaricaulota bacterium]|nr:PIN domain-containing protein [Candidatus Bipolaricaulota bacterium]